MINLPERLQPYRAAAEKLYRSGACCDIEFSGKTYQVLIKDPALKAPVWTFLQVDSRGALHDFFCECDALSEGEPCVHTAAGYLSIYGEHPAPLHVRFELSFWNILFRICSELYGDIPTQFEREAAGHYLIRTSEQGAPAFEIKAKSAYAVKKLSGFIEERSEETEETSLKFSNLTPEEIERWRAGRPSSDLRYELSLWNDLAKWFLRMQEASSHYSIAFNCVGSAPPTSLQAYFSELEAFFTFSTDDLPRLVSGLSTVNANLKVLEDAGRDYKEIIYHPMIGVLEFIPGKKQAILPEPHGKETIDIGGWGYVPGRYFYPIKSNGPIFGSKLSGEEIDAFLVQERQFAQALIRGTVIHEEPVEVHYTLVFDPEWNLHIVPYLHQPGDLSRPLSRLFGRWAYVQDEGFYELHGLEFPSLDKQVAPEELPNFIQQKRSWLNGQEGFNCRLSSVEAGLTYSVSEKERYLTFGGSSKLEEGILAHDFGPWVYVAGQGFFSKSSRALAIPTRPGTRIEEEQIPGFIRTHREELKLIPGFFSQTNPVSAVKVLVEVDEDGDVYSRAHYELKERYLAHPPLFFDEIAYTPGEGFFELPLAMRLPERFRVKMHIDEDHLLPFLTQDIPKLHPDLVAVDRKLIISPSNQLVAISFEKLPSGCSLGLVLRTAVGDVPLTEVWQGMKAKKRFLFTTAGLVDLHEKQFEWLKSLPKSHVDKKKHVLELSILDLMRLEAWEGLHLEIPGDSGDSARHYIQGLNNFRTDKQPDISKLTSKLRPYQHTGVQWLWFLYCHELSGLLCDDMGLGKTHQTMALIAASKALGGNKKYLIVCPTSVIYHWQEKLQTFLPDMRVHLFIGTDRELKDFEAGADILLTSYGIQRNEIELLKELSFEIAIFDEVQVAKNHLSRLHRALLQIKARVRIGLTGTPIENYLRELKALFDIVLPGYMPGEHDFRELLVKPIEKDGDKGRKELLKRLIRPFVLRRKKEDVLQDLPEKTEEVAHCDLAERQRSLYNETLLQNRDKLIAELAEEKEPVPYVHIFALLSQLKQICDHPALFLREIEAFEEFESGKWNLFVELLSEARDSNQKVVVFSQFLGMMDIIELYLKRSKIEYAAIRGNTVDRKEQLQRFGSDPNCEVFVASLQAAGLGIDLTAASVVIHYDRWWNAARENQATDRVHRIGQQRGVQVFKLVTKNTFEERIDALISRKAGLLDEFVSSDDQQLLKALNRRELTALLQEVKPL